MSIRNSTLLTVAALLLGAPARANGPEIGIDAGMIVPIASTKVELESEHVDIYAPLGAEEGRLECSYHLRNRSHKAVVVRMGFLVAGPSIDPVNYPSHWDDPALGLKASIAGHALAVHREPVRASAWLEVAGGAMPDSLPVWEVPIPADSVVRLLIESRITWSGGSDGDSHGMTLTYRARPARLWAGPIGHASIEFHLGNVAAALVRIALSQSGENDGWEPGTIAVRIVPSGFVWTWDGLRWTFDHWEPDVDPKLSIDWTDPATHD